MKQLLVILLLFASLVASSQNRDSVFLEAYDQAMRHALNVNSAELARLSDTSQTKAITDTLHRQIRLTILHKRKRLNTL